MSESENSHNPSFDRGMIGCDLHPSAVPSADRTHGGLSLETQIAVACEEDRLHRMGKDVSEAVSNVIAGKN